MKLACTSSLLSLSMVMRKCPGGTPRGEGQDQRADPEAFSRGALLGTVAWGWPVLRSCGGLVPSSDKVEERMARAVGLGDGGWRWGLLGRVAAAGYTVHDTPRPGDQHESHFHLSQPE